MLLLLLMVTVALIKLDVNISRKTGFIPELNGYSENNDVCIVSV